MVTIAIDSRLPAVQRSRLADALTRTGHSWDVVDDLSEWAASHPRSVVFAAASIELDPPLTDAANKQGVSFVAVAADIHDISDRRRWLVSNYVSIVDASAATGHLRLQVAAALRGSITVRTRDAKALATRLAEPPRNLAPNARHIAILHTLAQGGTLRAAAQRIHLSERHTRRLLRDLLDQMHAPTSYVAVAQAAQWGWIPIREPHGISGDYSGEVDAESTSRRGPHAPEQ